VNYQPKVLAGKAAERVITAMARFSGDSAAFLKLENGRGRIELSRPYISQEAARGGHD
jgi:hypothetical protein